MGFLWILITARIQIHNIPKPGLAPSLHPPIHFHRPKHRHPSRTITPALEVWCRCLDDEAHLSSKVQTKGQTTPHARHTYIAKLASKVNNHKSFESSPAGAIQRMWPDPSLLTQQRITRDTHHKTCEKRKGTERVSFHSAKNSKANVLFPALLTKCKAI